MTVGEKIKVQRKTLGLTQTELGEMLGVQKNAVSKWECGRVTDIPRSKINAMAAIFGVATAYLIDDEQQISAETDDFIHTMQIKTKALPNEDKQLLLFIARYLNNIRNQNSKNNPLLGETFEIN